MKLSTHTRPIFCTMGPEEGLKFFAECGFDTLDFSMFGLGNAEFILTDDNWQDYVINLKKSADSLGISFNQSHAPFPSDKRDNPEYTNAMFLKIARSIEISGKLGVKNIIVHPCCESDNHWETNMEFYNKLQPYAEKSGVKIALENMTDWSAELGKFITSVCSTGDDFLRYMEALDPQYFTACLDVGHSGLTGETAASMIRKLGKKHLTALHIHDNNYLADEHQLPFTRKINWKNIIDALKEIDYSGDFTFEVDNFLNILPQKLHKSGMKWMYEIGSYFVDELTN